MAKINPDLLDRLKSKLSLGPAAVYARIQKTSLKYGLPRRDLAALMLAWENNISIQKYANAEQMERLGKVGHEIQSPLAPSTTASSQRSTRKAKPGKPKKTKGNSVFVVHGRDEPLRRSIFAFLRALGLKPMEWSHAVNEARGGTPDVGEIIETAMAKVQAVVVLFSPDEMAHLKEQFWGQGDRARDGKPQGQPRPNVLFEAGLALGAHPDKTILVQVGKVRPFSDIAGKHVVRLTNEYSKRNDLANRLAKLGCEINKVGNDWMSEGNFEPTVPKKREVPPRRRDKISN